MILSGTDLNLTKMCLKQNDGNKILLHNSLQRLVLGNKIPVSLVNKYRVTLIMGCQYFSNFGNCRQTDQTQTNHKTNNRRDRKTVMNQSEVEQEHVTAVHACN